MAFLFINFYNMIPTWWSIEIDNNEDMLFTYSEEEKQDIEISKANSKLIYSPKFIPIYPNLLDELSLTEALLFWFIEFYKSNSRDRMYFTNDQLAEIIKCSSDTVSRAMSKLEKLWYIETSRKVRAWWWQTRYITFCDSTKTTSLTWQKLQARLVENLQTNNNNINDNNISSFNKEDISINQDCKGEEKNSNQDCNNINNNQDCNNEIINKWTVLIDCNKEKERKKKEITFDLDLMFEWFYNSYPRRTWRVAAKKAFLKAMRCDNDIWLLSYAVKKLAAHIKETNKDLQFVKHPSAYLNQEVFRDFEEEFKMVQQAQAPAQQLAQQNDTNSEQSYNVKFKRNYEE